ncbi:hypothetical protein EUX98_g1836 [Antrodiella citrinella]|uniref:Uncharacterized protein n=1 Tax=Antrodiella citrinella TaxID=2447956 RepID=A0A4S4N8T6_9APHY|nr:hypothetical protein EUX98_g1836 [Antrodiella citrinella]
MVLRLSEAGIISTSLQGMMYGFSVLMFILTGWILLRHKRRRQTNWGVMTAGFTLFSLSTAIFAVNVTRLQEGLLDVGPFLSGGVEEYFSNISQPTFVIKSTLYNVQTLVLDAVVIYRAYIAWQRWYAILLPVVSWLGLLATTIGNNIALATPGSSSSNVFALQYGRWISAVYSTTLATNLTATGLLAYRIWMVSHRAADYVAADRLNLILRVVIESGAIYSVAIFAALVCFLSGSAGTFVALDLLCPLINIVFNMIIVRVGLATDSELSPSGSVGPTSALDFDL